jgi:hypothetical protein
MQEKKKMKKKEEEEDAANKVHHTLPCIVHDCEPAVAAVGRIASPFSPCALRRLWSTSSLQDEDKLPVPYGYYSLVSGCLPQCMASAASATMRHIS